MDSCLNVNNLSDSEDDAQHSLQSETEDDHVSLQSGEGSDHGDNFLFEGSDITKDSAVLSFMNLYMKERWTKKSLDKTLKLMKSILPQPNELPPSSFLLFKYLESLAPAPQEKAHKYCRNCDVLLENNVEECDQCNISNLGQFYEFPIAPQIKYLFEQRNLAFLIDSMNETDNHLNFDGAQNITDIRDGTEYARVKNQLKGKYDLVLLWNTDGVALSRSSKCELYPVMCVLCEIPPKLRSSYVVVLGVWCDSSKPDMNVYLKPLAKSLKELYRSGGVEWTHPVSGQLHKSLITAPILCADAPAKAIVLNVKQYNSKFGCNVCEQKALKINPPNQQQEGLRRKRSTRRFVFQEDAAHLRSGERMDYYGNLAEQRNKSFFGVKGKCVISKIPFLDVGTCTCAEYLHSLMLGVVKYFTQIMLYKRGPWQVLNFINEIDDFIRTSIKVPDYLNRCPRELSQIKFWKGSEFRSWLLFYSLHALQQHLPDRYFQPWMLLVGASYYLLTDCVSQEDLNIANVMLRCFVRDIGELYGYEFYTYNVHNLLHLPLQVERWGPLWATSAFFFENINGNLRNLIHGTKNFGQELVNNIRISQGIQILRNRELGFLSNLPKLQIEIVFGRSINNSILLTGDEKTTLEGAGFYEPSLYKRAKWNGQVFTSEAYDIDKKRANSYIKFKRFDSSSFGQIDYFIEHDGQIHCLVRIYKVDHPSIFFHFESRQRISHLIPVMRTENLVVIDPKDVITKLIRVGKYFCLRPNSHEVNL